MPKKTDTSWDKSAKWYDELLEKDQDTYQEKLIWPNLKRLIPASPRLHILDLACGQGFFTGKLAELGHRVTGVDLSPALIGLAKKRYSKIPFHTAPAHELAFFEAKSMDTVLSVLAIQNMEKVPEVFKEAARVLKPGGRFLMVLNHPAFRVPKMSSWGWDDETKTQYRRVDRYLSELKLPIQMHPGDRPEEKTVSFHRPLQFYFKALRKAGFAVVGFEEWESHRKSQRGPRAEAEDKARKEIPLFLFLEATKI